MRSASPEERVATSSSSMVHDLKTLILSFHPVIAVETVEEDRVGFLLDQVAAELSATVFEWSVTEGLRRVPAGNMIHGTSDPLGVLRHIEGLTVRAIFHLKDFTAHLSGAAVARKFREVAQLFSSRPSTIVMTGQAMSFPSDLDHKVVHFDWRLPGPQELRFAIRPVLKSLAQEHGVELSISDDEIRRLIDALAGMTINQARQVVAFAGLIDGKVGPEDITHVIDRKAQIIKDGGLLEYYPVEGNGYELGGFAKLKTWLARARVGFSEEAKLLNLQPPKGILIVGVQGCGKSLAARVIAREWELPLLKLDAGRIYDKYIGESEKNLRKAIMLAESMSPAILWIDEIEKAMPGRNGADQDGGLSRRLFGTFLTWLQEKTRPVFLVATANDLSRMAPELLRKGRFDEIFFVDLPTPEERATIFRIHLELRRQHPEAFDVDRLVAASEGFSGAEIEQSVIGALYRALYQRRPLDTELLLVEIAEVIPLSVSRREDIESLRAAAGRFQPVQ